MKRVVLALALLALALAPAGLSGGFATVQLASLPDGTAAGGTWHAHLLVLQHGRTPLDGLAPLVRIRSDDGVAEEFPATPAGEPGRYDAEVTFPAAGTWTWEIWDGFSQTHTYSPVVIPAARPGGASFPALPVAAGVVATVLTAVAFVARRRRSSPRPALP